MVKEKNSDTNKYVYYSLVRVPDDVIDDEVGPGIGESKAIVVNYTIAELDKDLKGSLKFDTPIYMKWLEENFYEFFQIYWRGKDYAKTKSNRALLDFTATKFSPD